MYRGAPDRSYALEWHNLYPCQRFCTIQLINRWWYIFLRMVKAWPILLCLRVVGPVHFYTNLQQSFSSCHDLTNEGDEVLILPPFQNKLHTGGGNTQKKQCPVSKAFQPVSNLSLCTSLMKEMHSVCLLDLKVSHSAFGWVILTVKSLYKKTPQDTFSLQNNWLQLSQ